LERKGFIHRAKFQKRSIELVGEGQSPTIQLPVLSAAGCDNASIIADRIYDEYIDVSQQMLNRKNPENVVAIKAVGQSMVDAGIYDGDYVITEITPEAEENDLVVAVVDGMAVVKKISFANNAVILNPVTSDKSYRPIIVQQNFQIFGKVINSIKMPKQNKFKYVKIIDS
jgi:repressor LexA